MTSKTPAIHPSILAAHRAMREGRSFLAAPATIDPATVDHLTDQLPPGHLGVFSSGSTGEPRCISRTWESWTSSFATADALFAVDDGETVGLLGPWTSTMVLFAAMHALNSGATPLAGTPGELSRVGDLRVVHGVPTAASTYLDRISERRWSPPRLLVTAGATAPTELWHTADHLGIDMVEYYGAAELSFIGAHHEPGGFDTLSQVEVEIRDTVIWVRSPYLADGYLAGAEGALLRDGDWASVGDHGTFDDQGRLQISGRGDTAVTTAGHTVLVEDVERALAAIPGVHEIAVLGLPHDSLGEVLAAAFVADVDTGHLRAASLDLPGPMRPRAWFPMSALPRTANGKIDRVRLRTEVTR